MIRAVANQRLDLNDDEHEYYLTLADAFGKQEFNNLFTSDKNGLITSINPSPSTATPIILIFFLLNIMTNQRFRRIDGGILKLKDLEDKVYKLEEMYNELIQRQGWY